MERTGLKINLMGEGVGGGGGAVVVAELCFKLVG